MTDTVFLMACVPAVDFTCLTDLLQGKVKILAFEGIKISKSWYI